MCMTVVLSRFSMALKELQFENVSVLVVSKILGLFVNILTPDDKVLFLGKRRNLTQPVQMQLSNKLNVFLNFLLHL